MFSLSNLFNGLVLAGIIIATHDWARALPNRQPLPRAASTLRAEPVGTGLWRVSGARLAGAWAISGADPRVGGVSALAIDEGELVALTDSGVVIRFAAPTRPSQALAATIADVPAGPGSPLRKSRRDSEALAGDERGWWVAFENADSIWHYDRDFRSGREIIDLSGEDFAANIGIEALVPDGRQLLAFGEGGGERLAIGRTISRSQMAGLSGEVSDAARLFDGRTLLLVRRFGLLGFSAGLDAVRGDQATPLARMRFGPLDNPEAVAAAPLPNGGTRLWIMTDNDMRPWLRTLLVALDLP